MDISGQSCKYLHRPHSPANPGFILSVLVLHFFISQRILSTGAYRCFRHKTKCRLCRFQIIGRQKQKNKKLQQIRLFGDVGLFLLGNSNYHEKRFSDHRKSPISLETISNISFRVQPRNLFISPFNNEPQRGYGDTSQSPPPPPPLGATPIVTSRDCSDHVSEKLLVPLPPLADCLT